METVIPFDLHGYTAALMYRKRMSEVTAAERKDGKSANFFNLYNPNAKVSIRAEDLQKVLSAAEILALLGSRPIPPGATPAEALAELLTKQYESRAEEALKSEAPYKVSLPAVEKPEATSPLQQLLNSIHMALNDPAPADDGGTTLTHAMDLLEKAYEALQQPVRVVIDFTGGAWGGTIADRPVEVVVIDSHRDEVSHAMENPDLVALVKCVDGIDAAAYCQTADVDPEATKHFFQQYQAWRDEE